MLLFLSFLDPSFLDPERIRIRVHISKYVRKFCEINFFWKIELSDTSYNHLWAQVNWKWTGNGLEVECVGSTNAAGRLRFFPQKLALNNLLLFDVHSFHELYCIYLEIEYLIRKNNQDVQLLLLLTLIFQSKTRCMPTNEQVARM